MTLASPFIITARLLPGLQIAPGHYISIEDAGRTPENRTRYRYHIDTPEFSRSGHDLKSGCGGGTLQQGMESLLSFLRAAAECYCSQRPPMEGARLVQTHLTCEDNDDIFPVRVSEWAYQHSDELAMLEIELSENPDLIGA